MSPMFLGGLTARAIQLKNDKELQHTNFLETHPSSFVKKEKLDAKYKASLEEFIRDVENRYMLEFKNKPKNWHQADSVLAWISGSRFLNGKADSYGDPQEGQMWI